MDFNFLYYRIKAEQDKMMSMTQTGEGVPAVNNRQVQELEISIPTSISEQQSIASLFLNFLK